MKNVVIALLFSLMFNVISVSFFTIEIKKMEKENSLCKR